MKKLLLTLLLLPSLAFADHHRGHALVRLVAAEGQLNASIAAFERYAEATTFTDYQQSRAGVVIGYMNAAMNEIAKTELLLSCSAGDLHAARRHITQPIGNVSPTSAVRRVFIALMLANEDLHPANTAAMDDWRLFNAAAVRGWAQLDELSWHINDAILEEQFGQP